MNLQCSMQIKLEAELGCTIQHDGWPCNSCFHSMDLDLKHDIHDYWEAVLDLRGDYDDFNWPIETDTYRFPELIAELHDTLEDI